MIKEYRSFKPILDLINKHIEDGFISFRSLHPLDQSEISSHCIKVLGNDAFECLIAHSDMDKTLNLFSKYLSGDTENNLCDLLQTMAKGANEFFAKDMDILFDEMISLRNNDINHEKGLRSYTDQVVGEIFWSKY